MTIEQILGLFVLAIIFFLIGRKVGISTTEKKWKKEINNCIQHYEKLRLKFMCQKVDKKIFLSIDNRCITCTTEKKIWYLVKKLSNGGYEIISKATEEQEKKIWKQMKTEALALHNWIP